MAVRHLLTTGVLAACLALAGCGGDDSSAGGSASPSDSPTTSDSASPSASPTASPTPSPSPSQESTRLPTSQLEAAAIHRAVLDTSVARTAEQKAVVTAWMGFWQAAADTYYYAKEDPALARTSTGRARSGIVANMEEKKQLKNRIVGWARDNVTSVRVTGDRATVRDCTKNFTFTIDEDGEPITKPDPWYDVTGQLVRTDGTWKVTGQTSPTPKRSCLG